MENVLGLKRCLPEVLSLLDKTGDYVTSVQELNPSTLGTPVNRGRLYIIMWSRDVLPDIDAEAVEEKAALVRKALQQPSEHLHFESLLFPNAHPLVQEHLGADQALSKLPCMCKGCKGKTSKGAWASLGGKPTNKNGCQWRVKPWRFMEEEGLSPAHIMEIAEALPLTSGLLRPRPRHIAAILMGLNERKDESERTTVFDVSQSLSRNNAQTTAMPCITPNGVFYLAGRGRVLLPEEKMVMMGFPINACDCGCNTPSELSSIAGNAMHARAMGAALVIAFCVVDRQKMRDHVQVLKGMGGKRQKQQHDAVEP